MKFESGQSGNPNGRPKGSGHRQQLFNTLVEPHKEKLFETAISLALNGNEQMLRLFLDRLLPVKPADDEIYLNVSGSIKDGNALLSAGSSILNAMAKAEISPEQAKTLMATLESQRKQIESCDLANRVESIERVLTKRKLEK